MKDDRPENPKPTLSQRHAKGSRPKAEKSLGLSLLMHGLLAAGLVGVSFFPGSPQKPRRIYELTFGEREQLAEVAKPEQEQLKPEEVLADEPTLFEPLSETWIDTPTPLPDTTIQDEPAEVTPLEDWSEERLAMDFQALAGDATLLPQVEEPEPAPLPEPEIEIEEPAEVAPEPQTPKRVEGKDPAYPRLSTRLKEEGDVELRLRLDDEGRVRGVELVKSSGFSRLDEAAMSAAPKWRFDLTPPVGFAPEDMLRVFTHTVHFKLNR